MGNVSDSQHGKELNPESMVSLRTGEDDLSGAIEISRGDTRFGECQLAIHGQELIRIGFAEPDFTESVQALWPNAELRFVDGSSNPIFRMIDSGLIDQPLVCRVKATDFQKKVWQALLTIPAGEKMSYREIASQIGQPGSERAVGSAIAANPIGWVIPCHRVIRSDGGMGGFRWGLPLKEKMLKSESILFDEAE